MNQIAESLAAELVDRLQTVPPTSRLLVGVSGIPASGKSCLAKLIVDHANIKLSDAPTNAGGKVEATLIGLDGWHLTRSQLDAMPDPKLAHDRRGAHWTFDGEAYVAFVRSLRQPITPDSQVITAPSFDHAIKDPEPHAVHIHPYHRLIVIEGLYTFLSASPWKEAGELLDERWLVDIGIEEATRRLVKRHVATGITKDLKEANWRAVNNDMPNGVFLLESSLEPTRRIKSVEDPVFTT